MITNLIPFVSNQICYTKFSVPLSWKKRWVNCHYFIYLFIGIAYFHLFPVTDGKFYLETSFPGRSEIINIWRLLPLGMTYNGYGYQHQKHSEEKLLVHCLFPKLKTNTNFFPGLLLLSTTIISLTLGFKKKILNILWPSKGK